MRSQDVAGDAHEEGGDAVPIPAAQRVVSAEGTGPVAWILFLHGIFGAGHNWASVARALVRRRPGWGAALMDLRMHGDSRAFPPPHTVEACAADLDRLAATLDAPVGAVSGHSFGGKVALAWTASSPPALRQAWVVDSRPGAGPPEGSAVRMLEAVRALPERFEEREEVVTALRERGFEAAVARWMATNLEPGDGGYGWRFDVAAVEALLTDFFRRDLWSVVESPPPGVELRWLVATRSEVLDAPGRERIERALAGGAPVHLHPVEGGHWLNADNPDAVVDLLAEHLPAPEEVG